MQIAEYLNNTGNLQSQLPDWLLERRNVRKEYSARTATMPLVQAFLTAQLTQAMKGSDLEQTLEDRVRELLRFAGSDLKRCPIEHPRWDDDACLEDPLRGTGWPTEISLRVSSRPPVYHLDRAEVAGLGIEGDLLLGWQAGDAIAGDLG